MTNERLRSLCIKNDWFTGGTNEQYEKLFQMNEDPHIELVDIARAIWLCTPDWEMIDIYNALATENKKAKQEV